MKSLGLLFLSVLASIYNGWLLTDIWAWFIVPFGVMQLSLPHAIGISMFVGYLRISGSAAKAVKDAETLDDDTINATAAKVIVVYVVLATLSYWLMMAVHSFM